MTHFSAKSETGCMIESWQTPFGDFAERSIFLTIEGIPLFIYAFRPACAKEGKPAIIFYHGGGWSGGSPAQFFSHARYFASRGIVAFCVQYRTHEEPDDTTPLQAVERAKCAYHWVQSHAGRLGIDPARVVVSGSSAGGHLAAAVALLPEADRMAQVAPAPAAMVLFNPVTDTTPRGYHPCCFEGMNPPLDFLSVCEPHLVTPGTPATIIFHPFDDATVAFENSSRFRDLLLRAGVDCTLVGIKDAGHGYIYAGTTSPQAVESIRRMDYFLRDLGVLQGEPTIEFQEP